jgi:hypothetical protein
MVEREAMLIDLSAAVVGVGDSVDLSRAGVEQGQLEQTITRLLRKCVVEWKTVGWLRADPSLVARHRADLQ